LAAAWVWNRTKGLDDLINLSRMLPANYRLCIVGLSEKQRRELPPSIKGITRTENQKALAQLYSKASVFVNPTYGDTFPTTNLEALACGTPVVTYRTGGSPEAISESTGRVVERADIPALYNAIIALGQLPQKVLSRNCRRRAEELFDQRRRFVEYVDLYDSLIG
ncbi:MAG: glycosyltransferase, partial [Muribaculaceae bacterium]|nr:glycosyltransferase [Muribaculaceae bacterium]